MDAQRRKTFRIKFSIFHLLVFVYCLALAGILSWLSIEKKFEAAQVHIDSVKTVTRHGEGASLVFAGEGFHKALRGYYAERAHALKGPLWNILSGTSVRAIDVKDDLIIAACFQNKLVSIDVSDGNRPIILDSLEMPGTISAIEILNDKVVVGMSRGAGLAVVDLKHPGKLQLTRRIPTKGSVHRLVSAGSRVLFTDFSRGLGQIDIKSDRMSPEIVASIERPWGLASNGKSVAIASLLGVVELFDVSSEGVVKPKAKIQFPDLDKGDIRGVAFVDDYLLVALADRQLKTFTFAGERVFERSSLKLPGVPYSIMAAPENLYVSLVGSGVVKVDITSEGQCIIAGHQVMPTTVISMAVDEQVLYLSGLGNHKGFSAFYMNALEEHLPKSWEFIDDQYQSFYRWGNKLYGYRRDKTLVELSTGSEADQQRTNNTLLAWDNDGVGVFRSSADDENQIARHGSLVHPSRIMSAFADDGSLYLLHQEGLDVFVGPHIDSMNLVAELEIGGGPTTMAPLPAGHWLVATQQAGIMVVDLSAKGAPKIVSTLSPPIHLQSISISRDIIINDSVAYVSLGSGGVYVVDVSRLDEIKLLQIIKTPGLAKGLAVNESLLAVADGDMGVFLVDIANKREPLPIGSMPTPIAANSISFSEEGLLVSDHPGGTIKLPLPSRLERLTLIDSQELQANFSKTDRSGYVYLYDDVNSSRVALQAN